MLVAGFCSAGCAGLVVASHTGPSAGLDGTGGVAVLLGGAVFASVLWIVVWTDTRPQTARLRHVTVLAVGVPNGLFGLAFLILAAPDADRADRLQPPASIQTGPPGTVGDQPHRANGPGARSTTGSAFRPGAR
ncbi:MAG: hypothetical protein QM733_02455 [Ilumatobacteraceae bacterium]